jgi:hypothetical protein
MSASTGIKVLCSHAEWEKIASPCAVRIPRANSDLCNVKAKLKPVRCISNFAPQKARFVEKIS